MIVFFANQWIRIRFLPALEVVASYSCQTPERRKLNLYYVVMNCHFSVAVTKKEKKTLKIAGSTTFTYNIPP